ncbi:CCA tRNA nucleotidyltransferase [Roseovarius faecimaris]|uniref:CCA tRNA nucleotidyltransferase n=1 Tax=Roseovarius faecimaris TaxID=2494550 RepID=A0A6I6IWY2_9RHOB|nr:CCA tRNA nucleotidyltransferase [Roseovarius faecimaris]QGY00122.1 CCA tRNA nucleotidyltransferase [Roseovarius faecimaris]
MTITGDWIEDPACQAVCRMLTDAGHQALFVGGCVRNTLLGVPVGDIDIATDARPEAVIALAETAGLKAVPTGIEHGTVTVVSNGTPYEITTFRRDVETDGRRAVVVFADCVEDDARRRDFTMNALYARPDGTVIDPLGGLPDLEARRFRFIEDADERIREDYLRSLRFFRFNAWYSTAGAGLDPEALAAIAGNLEGLTSLSRERVGAEIVKLLSAPDPVFAVAAMRQAGVLHAVLPGADDRALGPLVHHEAALAVDPSPIRRLAALGGEDAAARLRLSKAQSKELTRLSDGVSSTMQAGELGYRHGAEAARDIILLRAALLEGPLDPNGFAAAEAGARAVLPVAAADFSAGYSGPVLGAKLREVEQAWIASGFALTREELLRQ